MRIRRTPLAGRLTSFVGMDRRPVGEKPRAAHYYISAELTATDGNGNTADVILEISAAQVVRMLRQFPTPVAAELTGIDRRQFMRASGMSWKTIWHIIGEDS